MNQAASKCEAPTRLNILHVVPTYLPAVRYGGPIYSVHGLAKGQAGLGHFVEVFATNVDGAGVSPVPLERPVDLDGVKVTYFPTGIGRRLYRSPLMGAALRRRVGTFDIVHLHSVFLWPTVAAARIAARRGVPYVLSPRGMLVADLIRRKSRLLKSGWIELFERRTIREAAALHLTAQSEARDLASFAFSLPPIWVLGNGVGLQALNAVTALASADVSAAIASGPFVLALGRINWKKNLGELVEAIAAVPTYRCIIAGNSEDDYANQLRRRARDLDVSDRVTILDRQIGESDKFHLYRACSVFVLASHNENFGNVVLEAMAFGKPVVVSSGAGVAALVAETGAGIVVAPNREAIANAVVRLISFPETRECYGRSGRRAVEVRNDWRLIAKEMVDLYKTVTLRANSG